MNRNIGRAATVATCFAVCAALTAAASPPASARPATGAPPAGRGVEVNYPRGGHRLPSVPDSAYVVADATTGQVLAAKDPDGEFGPASTLKILTTVTLMPALDPDATVVASQQAANVTPSKVGLIAGDRYQVGDLFKALLMISANDAAIALADATGSYAKGIAMMNAEARHLRADQTVAKTPNGLGRPGQHVTAYDEALIARQALKLPQFLADERLRTFEFPVKPRHKPAKLWTQNLLLNSYRGDIAGKIGWTSSSGATYIGWARRDGHTLIVTELHCTPLTELNSAAQLFDWGFANDGTVKPVGQLVPPLPGPGPSLAATRPSARPAARPAVGHGRQRASTTGGGRAQAIGRSTTSGSLTVTVTTALVSLVVVVAVIIGLAEPARRRRRRAYR